jgi:structural maintenance of chromosome 2
LPVLICVSQLLDEEINPKLARLRKEKESYLAYTKAASESERLGRLVNAFQYTDYNARILQRKHDIEGLTQEKAELERARKDRIKEKAAAQAEEAAVIKKRDEEMQKDGKMKMLEEDMAKHEKEAAKVQAQVEIIEGVIEENKRKAEEVQQALDKVCVSGYAHALVCSAH